MESDHRPLSYQDSVLPLNYTLKLVLKEIHRTKVLHKKYNKYSNFRQIKTGNLMFPVHT